MRKKLFALGLSFCLTVGTVGALNLHTADAAIKDEFVSENIFTDKGVFNERDWALKGDTAKTSFTEVNKGDIFASKNPVGLGYLFATDGVNFSEVESVKIEVDVLDFTGATMGPVFMGKTEEAPPNYAQAPAFYVNAGAIDTGPHVAQATLKYFADEEMTTPSTNVTAANYCVFHAYPYFDGAKTVFEYGTHVEYIFKADASFGLKSTPLTADGKLDEANTEQVWIKDMLKGTKADGTAYNYMAEGTVEQFFGLNWACTNIDMDNFKVSAVMKTPAEPAEGFEKNKVLVSTDFSGTDWIESNAANFNTGKVYYANGSPMKIQEIVATPANTDRIVSELKVKNNSSVAKSFTLNASLDFRTLGKKFGFAFGLQDQMGAIDAQGVSYLYFTQQDNVTYVNVMNNGTDGTPVSLEGDYVTGDFYNFSITANCDGTATLTVGTKTVNLTISNTEGYAAIVTAGEGTAEVAIGGETNLRRFIYRSSNGEAVENNFNTGFVPPDDFSLNSTSAVMFENSEEARGLILEDGKLRFAGTSDGTYLTTANEYADYIVEFKLEQYHLNDQPNRKPGGSTGTRLAVNLAVADGSGWASSIMLVFADEAIVMQDFTKAPMESKTCGISGYNFMPQEAGSTRTTAFKIIALNNVITVYYQPVNENETLAKDKYVKAAEFSVLDTYGKIAFASTDCGYWDIDDLRITPIDDPNPAVVEQNLANYVDFKEIADKVRPVALDAPVLTVDGNTVKWTAVENAAGYIVKINGTEREVDADVLSYTLQRAGDYTVTVIAKGNGSTLLNSEESDPAVFTVGSVDTNESSGGSQGGEVSSSGCGSVTGAAFLSLIAAAGAAFVIGKRKQD